jgi:hypothetical protein
MSFNIIGDFAAFLRTRDSFIYLEFGQNRLKGSSLSDESSDDVALIQLHPEAPRKWESCGSGSPILYMCPGGL